MRTLLLCLTLSLFTANSWAQTATPTTDEDKAFYSLGVMLGQNIGVFNLSEKELSFVILGLQDKTRGKENAEFAAFQEKLRGIAQERMKAQAAKEEAKGKAFLSGEAKRPGATTTKSGLVITHTKMGTGASPKATDKVKVHYRGTLIDGTEFDSSFKRNKPAEFPLNRVIPCWTEGVQLMKLGGKARLVCPAKIAYGERGTPGIPPNSTLIFEVELLEIVAAPAKPAAKPAAPKINIKPAAKPVAPAAKPVAPAAKPAAPAAKPAAPAAKPAAPAAKPAAKPAAPAAKPAAPAAKPAAPAAQPAAPAAPAAQPATK
jgi:FKBP-type peptidyl-prolyl cis-trans isomerase FkpA